MYAPPNGVLTNFYQFFFLNHVSYKPNKYSDFAKMKFFADFQILGYNKSMAILDNVDNLYPLFESESSSGGIENGGIQEICRNGCNCTSDHEFVQDFIDFDQ